MRSASEGREVKAHIASRALQMHALFVWMTTDKRGMHATQHFVALADCDSSA